MEPSLSSRLKKHPSLILTFGIILVSSCFVLYTNPPSIGTYKVESPRLRESFQARPNTPANLKLPPHSSETGPASINLRELRRDVAGLLSSTKDAERKRSLLISNVNNDKISHIAFYTPQPDIAEVANIEGQLRKLEISFSLFPDEKDEFEKQASLIRDCIHFGTNQETGEAYKCRIIAINIKTGDEQNEFGLITSSAGAEWGTDAATGTPWQKLTGPTRSTRIGPKTLAERYNHMYRTSDNVE